MLSSPLELIYSQCYLWDRGWLIGPISMGVEPIKDKEGGLPCGFARPIVVCKFCKWEIVMPVILSLVDPEPQILLEPLIGAF